MLLIEWLATCGVIVIVVICFYLVACVVYGDDIEPFRWVCKEKVDDVNGS